MIKGTTAKQKITITEPTTILTMLTAYEKFERKCVSKGLSVETIKSYRKHFYKFNNWFKESISDLNDEVILDYIDYLRDSGLKDVSVNTCLRHIKAIFRFFEKQGFIEHIEIEMVKVVEEIKDTYTDEEIKLLIKKPRKRTFKEIRSWAIVNFLIGTGCRLRTLVNIKVGAIKFESNEIYLDGNITKSGRALIIPLAPPLAKVLREYLSMWENTEDSLLFPNEIGEVMLTTSVAHDVAAYNKSRGVNKTSSHLFRHTFARFYIREGGDILRLKELLGHQSLNMVQHYAKIFGNDLRKDYDQLNILSRLTTNRITLKK